MQIYSGYDIYCDLIIPGKQRIKLIKETDEVLAFYHSKPHWQVHAVVTPKKHIASLLELSEPLATELLNVIREVAGQIYNKYGACRVITHVGNYQDSKHLHVHVSYGTVRE